MKSLVEYGGVDAYPVRSLELFAALKRHRHEASALMEGMMTSMDLEKMLHLA